MSLYMQTDADIGELARIGSTMAAPLEQTHVWLPATWASGVSSQPGDIMGLDVRGNAPLNSDTQWTAQQDNSATDRLDGLKGVGSIFDYWGAESRKLIDHIKESAQDQRTAITQSTDTEAVLLEEALADLRASPDEAKAENSPIPSTKALRNGEHVLREMYSMWSRRFEVYPMPSGEIAIDAPTGPGRSILVICDSEGGALCAVNFNRTYRRARYSDAQMLPDGFLRDAIRDLKSNV